MNELKFVAKDRAGNITEKTFTVIYRIILKLQIGSKTMYINDEPKEIDVPPTIVEGRTLLPIRWVAEPLGADVGWDGKERKVTVSLNDTTIELWIGKPTARVNGIEKPIDPNNPKVVPMILNGRTMLPVRFVAENLGADVLWDGTTKTVTIIYPKE
ncbi:MAG: copper amine oxidase N-terminal domain-containing protein [Caldisericia bacterium]|nr:copper amine oxidase N-terminal domain-containing protein [Caldisericia bacterium]